MTWYSHHLLYREIILDVTYKNVSPLRIGAGRGKIPTSPVDLPVVTIRIGDEEKPYIPGSSIKGVFRSTSELIARSSGIYMCNAGEECKRSYDIDLRNSIRIGDVNEILKVLSKYCLGCKIYGSASYSSHVFFDDAYPDSNVSKGVKTGIAIDRKSGTVRKGALFKVEFIEPGAVFKGKITMKNMPAYAMGLIFKTVELINSGFVKIGGFKTRGFGEVRIDINDVKGFEVENGIFIDIKQIKKLKRLDNNDKEIQFSDKFNKEEFIKKCIDAWYEYAEKSKSI